MPLKGHVFGALGQRRVKGESREGQGDLLDLKTVS